MKTSVFSSGMLLTALSLGLFCGTRAVAQQPEFDPSGAAAGTPSEAPFNPQFVEHLKAMAQGQSPTVMTRDGYWLGHLPGPLDLSHLAGQAGARLTNTSLPSSYDLRTYGRVTAVRNQSTCGSCWTFATFGSLESDLLTGESRDLSENNLKNLHGFDWTPCAGGNGNMSMAYLTRWDGPINESDDSYRATDANTSPAGLTPQKHVQNVLILAGRGSALTNDALKTAVMTYGAIHTSMTWDDAAYNAGSAAYYYSGSASLNHDVTLVGWDDNYSATNFKTAPAGDGAFLIKNSWGSSWGQSGYFWISYYDSKYALAAGTLSYVWMGSETTANYTRQYSYDPLGWVSSLG